MRRTFTERTVRAVPILFAVPLVFVADLLLSCSHRAWEVGPHGETSAALRCEWSLWKDHCESRARIGVSRSQWKDGWGERLYVHRSDFGFAANSLGRDRATGGYADDRDMWIDETGSITKPTWGEILRSQMVARGWMVGVLLGVLAASAWWGVGCLLENPLIGTPSERTLMAIGFWCVLAAMSHWSVLSIAYPPR
ncbi:MAG: hypothetical protein AAGB93_17715 [Planctomycetota bacterium]